MGPGLTRKRIGKSSQNSPKLVLIFLVVYHVYFVCIHYEKVVGHYDLSVLSMSVMGFQINFFV